MPFPNSADLQILNTSPVTNLYFFHVLSNVPSQPFQPFQFSKTSIFDAFNARQAKRSKMPKPTVFKAPFGNGPVKRRNEAPAIPTRHEKRSLLTSKPQNKLQKQAFWGRMSSMTHTRKLSKYRLFLINYFHIPYPAGKKKQQSNLALPVSIYPQFPPNVAEFDE